MTGGASPPIRLFQFPRLFDVPNLSPFCAKLETWLRMTGIPYEAVDTQRPDKGPKGKLPFIEDGGARLGDSTLIIDHLKKTRCVDPDASLDDGRRAIALLVQRTIEEHVNFIILYTHFIRPDGWRHTRVNFDGVPAPIRPLVIRIVIGNMRQILARQGILRHSDEDIMAFAIADWRAVLAVMSEGPYFFGAEPCSLDATVFGALATTVLTPIESPIRSFFPELAGSVAPSLTPAQPPRGGAANRAASVRARTA
jgi:glutathione S-transferase